MTGPARQSSSSRAAEPAAADDARAVPSRARRRLAAGAVTFAALALGCVAASSAWTRAGGARPPAAELARAGASARESWIEEVTTEVTEGAQAADVVASPAKGSAGATAEDVDDDAVKLAAESAAPKPHIILMTIDDLGYNDIGYSSTDIAGATPFLTSLAHAGVRLTSYYGQEMCTPARATLMTGRWAPAIGFQDTQLTERSTHGVPLWAKLLPEHLKDHGYATFGLGKWNIGFCNESYLPWNRGFDWFLGYMTQGISYYDHQASTYSYHEASNRTHGNRTHGPSKGQLALRKRHNGNATAVNRTTTTTTTTSSASSIVAQIAGTESEDIAAELGISAPENGVEADAAENKTHNREQTANADAPSSSKSKSARRLREGDTGNLTHTMASGLDMDVVSATTTDDGAQTERPLYDLLEGVAASGGGGRMHSTGAASDGAEPSSTGFGQWKTGEVYQGNYTTHLFGEKAMEHLHAHFNGNGASTTGRSPAEQASEGLGDAGVHATGDFAASGGDTAAQPLFMWIAFHAVHRDDDSEPPGHLLTNMEFDYLHNTLPERGIATNRARLAEALMPVDVAAKRIVKKLEDAEALHKSVIVVHSDNGGDTCHAIGDVAPWGSNWPLRGRKMSYFEGGVRVPAFVYAPSLIPKWRVGGTYNGLMHHVDWVATFVRLAGGNAAALREEGYASLDHWDAIAAGPKYNRTVRDELVLDLPQNSSFDFLTGGGGGKAAANLADWHGVVALRVGNFKLLYTMGNETWFPSEMRSDTCPYYAFSDTCATNLQALSTDCEWSNFLFDVVNDPYERNNLFHSDEHAGLRASLEARAATLLAEYSGAFDKNVAFGTTGTTWSAAREAFYKAGDYVVPWGCSAV